MRRFAIATIATATFLAGTGAADAAPPCRPRPPTQTTEQVAARSRTSCERYARVEADRSGAKRGTREWRRAYEAAYLACISRAVLAASA